MILLYLTVGGAIGTLLRYAVGGWVHSWAGTWLPWGTLVINVSGSFVLGFAMRTFDSALVAPELRAFVTIGLCGAFTTFSTYTYETMALVQEGDWLRAALYSIGSVLLGLLGVAAGIVAATVMLRGRIA